MKIKSIKVSVFPVVPAVLFVLLSSFFGIKVAAAYQIEELPDKTVYSDFVVGPGKITAELKPGESRTVNVITTNRMGRDKIFSIEIEDFTGSRDIAQPVVLLGQDRGPYSLKDYLNIASTTFRLRNAERATVPVTIRIPTDAPPGGLYGSIVISTATTPEEQVTEGNRTGRSPIVTRIGTLFFVTVPGDVKEDAKLTKFSLRNDAFILGESKQIDFRLLFENNGTIHENPYGIIKIKNMLGSNVDEIVVEPWFSLPDSLRLREIAWKPPFLFGRYTATASINRGYDNLIDEISISFWVIPWKLIGLIFLGLVIIILGFRWIFSKFKFKIVVKK